MCKIGVTILILHRVVVGRNDKNDDHDSDIKKNVPHTSDVPGMALRVLRILTHFKPPNNL